MEAELIAWLRDHVPAHRCLEIGIGDDAAVVASRAVSDPGRLVVTTDLLSDGVDFLLSEVEPRRIGCKALAVNLSDLAAMAAEPRAAVVALALRRGTDVKLPIAIYEGMLRLAEEFDVAIAGGDTNTHDGPLVISVTALGEVTEQGPLTRSGGRTGDRLLVTGQLGGSIQGHHLDFTPRVREALLLAEKYELHAGIDISDGLALDASRLAAASGCGAVIDVDRLPMRLEGQVAKEKAVERALGDGEDFELLLAVSPNEADRLLQAQPIACGVAEVGELVAEPGLWQRNEAGQTATLETTGHLHD